MSLEEQNPEVLWLRGSPRVLAAADLELLAERTRTGARGRCRICLHDSPQAAVHEMVIGHARGVRVPVHAHRDRDETFTILSGAATVVLLSDDGGVEAVVPVAAAGSGRALAVRIPRGRWHTQLFEADVTVFHEVTTGPFDPAGMVTAPFAPRDEAGLGPWLDALRARIGGPA